VHLSKRIYDPTVALKSDGVFRLNMAAMTLLADHPRCRLHVDLDRHLIGIEPVPEGYGSYSITRHKGSGGATVCALALSQELGLPRPAKWSLVTDEASGLLCFDWSRPIGPEHQLGSAA
jgi:hypothetical protein